MKTKLFLMAAVILAIVAGLAFWLWYATHAWYWIDLSAGITLAQWIATVVINRRQQKRGVQAEAREIIQHDAMVLAENEVTR